LGGRVGIGAVCKTAHSKFLCLISSCAKVSFINRKYLYPKVAIKNYLNHYGPIYFGDAAFATAIVDRLVHHAYIFKINGKSYKIKEFIND
jgi:hypothetical protein